MLVPLTEENYVIYAMRAYNNPQCTNLEEFHEDLNRTKYLKRLFRRYKTTGNLRERLILNHIIIFFNVFGIEAASRLLFFRLEEDLHSLLKTFLVYLNFLPQEGLPEARNLVSVPLEDRVVKILRRLDKDVSQ